MLYHRSLLVIYIIYSSVFMLIPNSQFIPPLLSPLVTISLLCLWVYLTVFIYLYSNLVKLGIKLPYQWIKLLSFRSTFMLSLNDNFRVDEASCFFLLFHFLVFFFFYMRYNLFLLVIYFIHISVYMSIPISQFIPPPTRPAFPPWYPFVYSLHLCLYFCLENGFICIIFLDSTYMR